MALDLGPNVEDFNPLPTPHVRLYGSASDAGGHPLAKIAELVASRHNFTVVIELPKVQCGDSKSYLFIFIFRSIVCIIGSI